MQFFLAAFFPVFPSLHTIFHWNTDTEPPVSRVAIKIQVFLLACKSQVLEQRITCIFTNPLLFQSFISRMSAPNQNPTVESSSDNILDAKPNTPKKLIDLFLHKRSEILYHPNSIKQRMDQTISECSIKPEEDELVLLNYCFKTLEALSRLVTKTQLELFRIGMAIEANTIAETAVGAENVDHFQETHDFVDQLTQRQGAVFAGIFATAKDLEKHLEDKVTAY